MPMPNRDRQLWRQRAGAVSTLTLLMVISGSGLAADPGGQPDPTLDQLSSLLRGNLLLEAQARQKALLAELGGTESTMAPVAAPPSTPSTVVDAGEPDDVGAASHHDAPQALPQPVAIYGGGGVWVASLRLPDGKQVDVRAGQHLEGYRVRGIDATSVVLQDTHGKPHTLTLVGGPS